MHTYMLKTSVWTYQPGRGVAESSVLPLPSQSREKKKQKQKTLTFFEGEQTILSLSLFAACCREKTGRLLIPIINSWAQRIDATECQATDFCAVVHRLNSSLLSFVPISLPDSSSHSLCPAFSRSHLLPLTFCAPRSLFSSLFSSLFFFFIILFLCYCLSPPCPFL